MPRLLVIVALLAGSLVSTARAADPDNCLYCHGFRGLSRHDAAADRVHVYYVDPSYIHNLDGPHARLSCTACHERAEVGVIPHQPVTRVNCTQTCHLTDETGQPRRFSHANVAAMLEHSTHPPATLNALEFAGGPLLEPGQSACLYCHDEPVFRDSDLLPPAWIPAAETGTLDRCDVCHLNQVPVDVRYYVRHVAARLQPARPPLGQAQVCAACHADAAVLEAHELSNTVASFVRSFHGKAALLGEETTASCLDCHVSAGDNAHRMLASENPASSVHPDNVANTCRSYDCHPGADVALGAAAVHLDLPTAHGTLEFFIAAGFIVLTVLTFGPSLLLCLLEQFQLVIGRHPPQHEAPLTLTQRVLAHPAGRSRLKRFTVSQRVQHWVLALLFVTLALTGFPMKFAEADWSAAVVNTLGGLTAARHIHHWAGVALVAGFFAHAVYALMNTLKNARQTLPDGRRRGLFQAFWEMPMLVRPSDILKMNLLLAYLVGLRKAPPTFGRFTIKEKFEYIGVFWGTVLLGVTGALLWGEQRFSHVIDGRVLNIALIAHTYEAFLAIIHVGILHIVNVTLSPHVFPLSPATITGDTPTGELAEQHSEFVADAARDLGIATDDPSASGGLA